MLEIIEPTKSKVIEILESLASGSISRNEVIAWQNRILKEFDYYRPGTYTVPLTANDGYWEFVTFGRLLDSSEIQSISSEPFVRHEDFVEFSKSLRKEDLNRVENQLSFFRFHQAKRPDSPVVPVIEFNDENVFARNSMHTTRGVMDNLYQLQECSQFNFLGKDFLVFLEHENQPGAVTIHCECSDKEIVASLLFLLGVDPESINWISESLDSEPRSLSRLDDNGNTFTMGQFNTYIETELLRQLYQSKGHKQTYAVVRTDQSNS